MAQSGAQDPSFPYVHLWVSADGETHLQECTFKNFEKKAYAAGTDPQFTLTAPPPSKVVLTELVPHTQQDWHAAPAVQMVTCTAGSWYVKASDGTRREFKAGEILFQDNTKDSPAAKEPHHFSGTVGEGPCQQVIVQMSRKPEIDNPGPL